MVVVIKVAIVAMGVMANRTLTVSGNSHPAFPTVCYLKDLIDIISETARMV